MFDCYGHTALGSIALEELVEFVQEGIRLQLDHHALPPRTAADRALASRTLSEEDSEYERSRSHQVTGKILKCNVLNADNSMRGAPPTVMQESGNAQHAWQIYIKAL